MMRINSINQISLAILTALTLVWFAGCSRHRAQVTFAPQCEPCQQMLQQIEYPDLMCDECTDGSDLVSPPPITISEFQDLQHLDITLDECVELALANSKVMNKLGGVVVNSPAAATTLYDQALRETNPNQSVEAALSAFDAQFNSSFNVNQNERQFNNPFIGGGADSLVSRPAAFNMGVQKTTASGTTFAYRNLTNYDRSNSPANTVPSTWDVVNQIEFRQPLLRGRGASVNRIAGPNAIAGNYNGVLLARIRSDISLADFESAVRNLVRDVENNYWELYFAYRDLDTKLTARDAARETWENRKLRLENGVGRPDDEAQARQQYLNFQTQAQNAMTGVLNGQTGVLGAERNLRRLTGMPVHDGTVFRPVSEPTVAPIQFDWNDSQAQTLGRRVELRRQKWTVRQRELELIAAKALNKWQFDMTGQYGFRGFGDDLFGGDDNAWDSLLSGTLDDWRIGLELNGPIGNRQGHLAVRNAELNLVREKTLLREQQRQVLHDLGAAFTEVDRSMANMRMSFNSLVAVQEELEPKRKRVQEGQDQVFFLLDAQQRAATAESSVHRAIVDYNRSLVNYAYTSGSLLSRYGVVLTEGPWCEDAQINAREKACRYEMGGPNQARIDNYPVGAGAYNQEARGASAMSFSVQEPVYAGDLNYDDSSSYEPDDNFENEFMDEPLVDPVNDLPVPDPDNEIQDLLDQVDRLEPVDGR